jgi:glycosyltransferase involved in cell wall biosynthesis
LSATAKTVHLIGQLRHGGAERQVTYVASALSGRGWPQAVVSFDRGGVWRDRLRDAGIPVAEIPRTRMRPWRLWRLFRILRHDRPAVVVHWSQNVAVYSQLVGCGRWPRRVFNVRFNLGRDHHTGEITRLPVTSRYCIEHSDHVISNAAATLDALRGSGVRLRQATVIPNIVACAPQAAVGEGTERPRIAVVGSLIPRKGLDVLLHALAMVAAEGFRYELLIAGDGPERSHLEALSRQLGQADRVRFLGTVQDVPALLATVHMAVHASRSEGLSNAVLEAMAAGLPVIATAVDGTPEVVEDGHSGILVPPGESDALHRAIKRLLRDPGLRARLGGTARLYVRDRCSVERVTDAYEGVLRSLLGGWDPT